MLERYNRYEIATFLALGGSAASLLVDYAVGTGFDFGPMSILQVVFALLFVYGGVYGLYYKQDLSMPSPETDVEEDFEDN